MLCGYHVILRGRYTRTCFLHLSNGVYTAKSVVAFWISLEFKRLIQFIEENVIYVLYVGFFNFEGEISILKMVIILFKINNLTIPNVLTIKFDNRQLNFKFTPKRHDFNILSCLVLLYRLLDRDN